MTTFYKISLAAVALSVQTALSQTNTFPSSGKVGIGTVSPNVDLTVQDVNPYIELNSNATKQSGLLFFDNSNLIWQIGNNYNNDADGNLFFFKNAGPGNIIFAPNGIGYVGIGTTNPTYPLSVSGTIEAKEVIVQSGWSDFVFDKDYKLGSLKDLEASIAKCHHLPGVPSSEEISTTGVPLGQIDAKLLQKIEELTLYAIEQEKRIDALEESNAKLRSLYTAKAGSK